MKPRLVIRFVGGKWKWMALATRPIYPASAGEYFVLAVTRHTPVFEAVRLYKWELS